MDDGLARALNRQLNQELRNAYLYMSMAAYFEELSLSGFAHYFMVQAREELEHAMRIFRHLADRGVRIELLDIPAPVSKWESPLKVIEAFLAAERENTSRIWELYELAKKTGDKATEVFLHWFINEQVEEEKNAMDLLAKVKAIGDNYAQLLVLDRFLTERK